MTWSIVARDPATGQIGVEPMTYSGSGDLPRVRDRIAICAACDGTGVVQADEVEA